MYPKILFLLFIACLFSFKTFAQSAFEKQYETFDYTVKSSVLEKRIFYLPDEASNSSSIKNELNNDEMLHNLYKEKIDKWNDALKNCSGLQCLANALLYSDSENAVIQTELGKLYHQSEKIR